MHEINNLNVGQQVPELSMQDIHGHPFDLADYRGRVVLLDFWATWCGPCLRELPRIRELASRYPSDRFAVVGISLDEDIDELKQFVEAENIPWPQLCDGKRGEGSLAKLFNVRFLPYEYVLGADGKILGKSIPPSGFRKSSTRNWTSTAD